MSKRREKKTLNLPIALVSGEKQRVFLINTLIRLTFAQRLSRGEFCAQSDRLIFRVCTIDNFIVTLVKC